MGLWPWHRQFSHMNLSSCYKVGRIIKPHGIKGNVTIFIDAEAPANFHELSTVYAEQKKRLVPLSMREISIKGNLAYVHFEDINTLDEAASLRQCDLYLPKETRPKPTEGEFYNDEIIGYEVMDKESGPIGMVYSVMFAGQNKLLVVRRDERELLIPVNAPFITKIIRSTRKIHVNLPPGFLDI
jgi:16S rRNA processing protein RimM